MRVRTRLLTTLAAVLLLASLPGWYAVQRVQMVRDIALELRAKQASAALAVGRYQAALAGLESAQRTYVVLLDSMAAARVHAVLRQAEAQLDALEVAGYAEASAPARASFAGLTAVASRLEALGEAGDTLGATQFLSDVAGLYPEAGLLLDSLTAAIDRRSAERTLAAERISASTAQWGIVALLFGALAAAAIGLYTSADLAGALRRLRSAHARLGEGGEPDGDVPTDRADEIGDLARSFSAMAERLHELDRLKAEFVSMASHEIKAPAGMIGSYAELLAEELDPEDEEARELLDAIHSQSAALSRQVQLLLELTRLEAGGFRLRVEEVDTRDFLESVVQAFRPLARAAELDLRVEVAPSVPERVVVDPESLRIDVLGNLLGNAFKFSRPGGSVRLAARGEGSTLHLGLSDTGAGIPAEQLPFVFEKYWQAGRQSGKVGSGLGLAIARMVVEAHGGRIGVRSAVGKGTTFDIVLTDVGVAVHEGVGGAARRAVPA